MDQEILQFLEQCNQLLKTELTHEDLEVVCTQLLQVTYLILDKYDQLHELLEEQKYLSSLESSRAHQLIESLKLEKQEKIQEYEELFERFTQLEEQLVRKEQESFKEYSQQLMKSEKHSQSLIMDFERISLQLGQLQQQRIEQDIYINTLDKQIQDLTSKLNLQQINYEEQINLNRHLKETIHNIHIQSKKSITLVQPSIAQLEVILNKIKTEQHISSLTDAVEHAILPEYQFRRDLRRETLASIPNCSINDLHSSYEDLCTLRNLNQQKYFDIQNSQTQRNVQPQIDPYQIFYNLTVQAVKLNLNHTKIFNTKLDYYYAELIRDKIQFNQWTQKIEEKLIQLTLNE